MLVTTASIPRPLSTLSQHGSNNTNNRDSNNLKMLPFCFVLGTYCSGVYIGKIQHRSNHCLRADG